MEKLRVGLVGCGAIANLMHLPGLKMLEAMGKVGVVAVCDAVEAAARGTSERFEIPTYFTDLGTMLEQLDFDLLVNTTPIPQHFAISLAGLRAGHHVYTQKPMATTLDEATILIDEAQLHGVVLGCAPEHPVRPVIRKIRELIDAGTIGTVSFARVQSSHDGPEKHNVPRDSTWFYQPGSSPILDLGVHGLSQITSILGPIKRVACLSGRSRPVRITTAGPFKGKQIEVNIDDNSLMMLDFGDAKFSFLDASYCLEASLGPQLEVYGSDGTLSVVSGGNTGEPLHLYRSSQKEWVRVELPPASPIRDLGIQHMVETLLDGTELVLTGARARHLLEVMLAAPRAATEGRTIELTTAF